MIRKALSLLAVFVFASTAAGVQAQTTQAPPNALARQIDKIQVSIGGTGVYNDTVSGTIVGDRGADNQGQSLTEFGSNTAGVLLTVDFPAKWYFGLEINYGYARYTENFEGPAISNFLPNGITDFQVQTDAKEYTFGYLITSPYTIYGLQPFFSAGFGPQAFKPTPLGGQEEPEKARMTYFYSLGVQKDVSPHFGLKAGYRQLFFLDPDFGQNYLIMLQHATTYEPTAGFYFRF